MKSISRTLKTLSLMTVAWFGLGNFADTAEAASRDVSQYNLTSGIGLKGYDPVSYFPEGGGVPTEGSAALQVLQDGVIYQFSSIQNRDLFVASPERFEPTYGGWCAYAMASGAQVDVNPDVFTIHGNRLHLFVSRRAKSNFDLNVVGHETRADGFWKQISGEDPRL